jgi:predicted nucleotidyltransferase
MKVAEGVDITYEQIEEFCKRRNLRSMSLFGSALRGELTDSSDVDFLVEYDPDSHYGYFDIARMEFELEAIIGRRVDLRTKYELSRYFRDEVTQAARVLYLAS